MSGLAFMVGLGVPSIYLISEGLVDVMFLMWYSFIFVSFVLWQNKNKEGLR